MFGVLAVSLVVELLSFGGVLRHTWLAVQIFWLISLFFVLVFRFIRARSLDTSVLLFTVVSACIVVIVPPKFGVGLMAAAWAYLASLNGESKVLRFFHFLVAVGVLEAFLGLVQYFVAPGWILGYQNKFYATSGTLINRNHFAGLLEMLIPVTFGLAYYSVRRSGEYARAYIYLLVGAFVALALLFSLSRMGIFSFLSTVLFLGIVLQFRKSQRRTSVFLAFGMVGLVLAGAIWVGIDGIVERYSQLTNEESIMREGRIIIFRDALRMIAATPGGVGTGNFQDRYRPYQTFQPSLLVDHAHNDYLETAAEWGVPVAAAFWAFLIFAVFRAVRVFLDVDSPGESGILLACAGAIFAILVHSLADFNLQIPSNAMLFFSFVGVSLAFPAKGHSDRVRY